MATACSFNNQMYIFGGAGSNATNDVWSSVNGSDWTLVTPSASWSSRYGHQTVIFENKIILFGGNQEPNIIMGNDLWISSFGENWEENTLINSFTGRYDFSSVLFNNKIYIFAGICEGWIRTNDIWVSYY